MLIYNLYGNILYQQIKGPCEAEWVFKTYMMVLLIAVYCAVFLYAIFAASLRECLKRYHILVYKLEEWQIEDYLESEDESTNLTPE